MCAQLQNRQDQPAWGRFINRRTINEILFGRVIDRGQRLFFSGACVSGSTALHVVQVPTCRSSSRSSPTRDRLAGRERLPIRTCSCRVIFKKCQYIVRGWGSGVTRMKGSGWKSGETTTIPTAEAISSRAASPEASVKKQRNPFDVPPLS